jgi:peptidoglycan/LPS O-acetylase OafA/YrhL
MLAHKPQLDSLRALAVSAVLLGHFANVPIAAEGVELFFVLSGFLITRILIDGKSQFEHVRTLPRLFLLRQFYVRRFLRIFPPYYLLLLGLAVINLLRTLLSSKEHLWESSISFWESMWFHTTYTSNFWFAFTGRWDPWVTSHFWSLAIEEQFYLFWPWIVISVPKRNLWIAATLLSASAPLFRGAMLACNASRIAFGTLTPTYFDFLGLGGLLAVVWEKRRAELVLRLLGGAAIVILGVSLAFGFATAHAMILWALAFTALVSKAAKGFTGAVGYFLNWPVLRYLGRISYGIYLYHLPAFLLAWKTYEKFGGRFPGLGPKRFVIAGTITVLIAAVSWHFLERPINRLKRFFPYQARAPRRDHLELAAWQAN